MFRQWFVGKTRVYVGLVAALLLLGALAALGSVWWAGHGSLSNPASNSGAETQRNLELAPPLLGDVAAPIVQEAVSTNSNVLPVIGVAPRLGGVMPLLEGNSSASGGLLTRLALALLGVLVVLALLQRRRAFAAPVLTLVAAALVVTPSLPALADAGTATRWLLPHTFSDYPYAPAKDAPNQLLYFAEHMTSGTDAGRIGQLNLLTNDLVEWPTTGVPGTSMTVVGGNVFFTEPAANIIGKLDPPANSFTRWSLPTAGDDAIIFWVDGSGNVWYLSLSAAKVGRLNPSTNDITEWAMAAPGVPIKFYGRDASGYMWFSIPNTTPNDSKIGRLDVSSNQLTLWPLPATMTELAQVVFVAGNWVWFSGLIGNTTLHIGRLDAVTNQVKRWTVVPTDVPGITAYPIGYYSDYFGTVPSEVSVAKGLYRQFGVGDSVGPWFEVTTSSGNKLTHLDPGTNQLLEFDFTGYKLVEKSASNVITALLRIGGSASPDTIVFFDTTTNSETRFTVPYAALSGEPASTGFLRVTDTEFWFTRPTGGSAAFGKIERLVILP